MNDERPIEKVLRRYAKKRRDEAGAPPALHPATRRLLQGEVARQYPRLSPEEKKASATGFFALLTQRWIYAVGVFVVLGVTAVVLLPSLNKSNGPAMLAQKETEKVALRESIAPAAAPAPVLSPAESQPTLAVAENRLNEPAPEPGGASRSRSRDESAALSYVTNAAAAASSPARLADAKTDGDSLRKAESAKQVSLGVSLDSATPATRALTIQRPARPAEQTRPADSLSLAGGAKAGRNDAVITTDSFKESRQTLNPTPLSVATAAPTAGSTGSQDKNFFARGGGVEKDAERFYSQSFANVAPEQLRAKAAKVKAETPIVPVLANFQVQNVGNELRVIDSDGSTYRGVVSAITAGEAGVASGKEAVANYGSVNLGRAQAAAYGDTAKLQATQNYLWRVEGTNRTLNQNVVFTWNFVNVSNTVATTELKAASGALNQDASKLPSQFPALLNNSVINGRAQLGPTQQIEVNAVPVK